MALKVYEIVYILQTIKMSVLILQQCNRGKNRAFFKLRLKEQNKKAKILITYHILNINMFQI